MTPPNTPDRRERIAKIVKPNFDNCVRCTAELEAKLVAQGQLGALDTARLSENRRGRDEALAKADAILADDPSQALAEALERAEGWFLDYERQHRAKGTPEAEMKADTNEERAAYLHTILKAFREEG